MRVAHDLGNPGGTLRWIAVAAILRNGGGQLGVGTDLQLTLGTLINTGGQLAADRGLALSVTRLGGGLALTRPRPPGTRPVRNVPLPASGAHRSGVSPPCSDRAPASRGVAAADVPTGSPGTSMAVTGLVLRPVLRT